MLELALIYSLALGSSVASEATFPPVLKGVENHYNRAKTLEVSFTETFTGQGRPRQSESGKLTLRKPGRMRWEYTSPAGKLFLSDGKQAYLYTPLTNRVEQMPLKQSDDMRAPLAFLLGKLDFAKEFGSFTSTAKGDNTVIGARAKSDKLPYESVKMLINQSYEIRRLEVTGQDRSILIFQFDQEKVNPPLDDKQFKFQLPPGAKLADRESEQ